jgi:hypothetical protein
MAESHDERSRGRHEDQQGSEPREFADLDANDRQCAEAAEQAQLNDAARQTGQARGQTNAPSPSDRTLHG